MARHKAFSLIGKTVKKVTLNPFPSGRGESAYMPVIEFDDGTKITFYTQETEVGEYGTDISVHEAT